MEARMSICNMSIEAGARAGMIAPDDTTFEYLKSRPLSPKPGTQWERAVKYWSGLKSDPGAKYDEDVLIDAKDIVPTGKSVHDISSILLTFRIVTWGTSPQDVCPINGVVPNPDDFNSQAKRESAQRALDYMGLTRKTLLCFCNLSKNLTILIAGTKMEDIVL